jgi:hypothetical protein
LIERLITVVFRAIVKTPEKVTPGSAFFSSSNCLFTASGVESFLDPLSPLGLDVFSVFRERYVASHGFRVEVTTAGKDGRPRLREGDRFALVVEGTVVERDLKSRGSRATNPRLPAPSDPTEALRLGHHRRQLSLQRRDTGGFERRRL